MILCKNTSQRGDPNYVLVFTVHLGMSEILTDFPSKQKGHKWQKIHAICLHPVGKSVNISDIPRCTVKNKT